MHRNEKEIIRVLFNEGRTLSVHELADLTGMSWVTSKKYADRCMEKQAVRKAGRGYEIEPALLEALYTHENQQ